LSSLGDSDVDAFGSSLVASRAVSFSLDVFISDISHGGFGGFGGLAKKIKKYKKGGR